MSDTREILDKLSLGEISVDEAEHALKVKPYLDLGYANIDLHRKVRQGSSEVIYGEGKSAEQITGILQAMIAEGQESVLVTRLGKEKAQLIASALDLDYHDDARIGIVGRTPYPTGIGTVLIMSGGTSDIPVAEEAALTAEMMSNKVKRVYDVGVAGIHRTLAHLDDIIDATVIVAVAGMEGALASLIGGMASCPVIAVPTSVGYGASFGGIAALLSMLNSCASGVSVVNIDNGFGAGVLASKINHTGRA